MEAGSMNHASFLLFHFCSTHIGSEKIRKSTKAPLKLRLFRRNESKT
jgi:hypothetical protein